MADRLGARDLALLADESVTAPRHNATLDILDPDDSGLDYLGFLALVAERLPFVPRYRQRVHAVPGRLAAPRWVDDDRFDVRYHVRRSALPRPGDLDQLRDLVARIIARPLDRSRPLWEMYFIEGLEHDRVVVLTKSHQAMVDGIDTVDLGQLLLDVRPDVVGLGADAWEPRTTSGPALVLQAVRDNLTDVEALSGTALGVGHWLAVRASGLLGLVTGAATQILGTGPERVSPLTGALSQSRLVVALDTDLDDYRRIRDAHGGTINDAILAVIAGGLRAWLMSRDESLRGVKRLVAVVPVSVIDSGLEATSMGSQIAPHYVELPIGEVSPVVRLHQLSYSFDAHHATGRAVPADRLAGITGFAPATFHAMGSRLAAAEIDHGFALPVTNVPGPQSPRYAAGARLLASYPVHPLLPGHAVSIGVTSYDGRVFFGITADRELVPDADVLGHGIVEALDELRDTIDGGRLRAPRGRRKDIP